MTIRKIYLAALVMVACAPPVTNSRVNQLKASADSGMTRVGTENFQRDAEKHDDTASGDETQSDTSAEKPIEKPIEKPSDTVSPGGQTPKPSGSGGATPVVPPNDPLPVITWKRDLPVGENDTTENLIGGTEIRALAAFDGKLFASNGYWTDKNANQVWLPGPQVFMLDKPLAEGGKWKIDLMIDERLPGVTKRRFQAISVMKAIRFERDRNGQPLPKPVDLLVVSVWDRLNALHVFTRDTSGPGSWTRSTISPLNAVPAPWHVRSFSMYRDKVTGGDILFAGSSGSAKVARGVFRAYYDAAAPGKLSWVTSPETWGTQPGPNDRVMSMTEANGKLYATVCGKLYERADGAEPRWNLKYRHPADRCPETPGEWSYRGATTIKNTDRTESIITSMEGTSIMERFDFSGGFKAVRELALAPFLAAGLRRPSILYTIAAYNDVADVKLPDGRTVQFAGLEALVGAGQPNTWHGWQAGAWYIVRSATGAYKLFNITPDANQGAMVSTRAIIQSPFASEPWAIYAGGFDANHIENENHNTAWLYRGEMAHAAPPPAEAPASAAKNGSPNK